MSKGSKQRVQWSKEYEDKYNSIFGKTKFNRGREKKDAKKTKE